MSEQGDTRPRDKEKLLQYIVRHKDSIFVREEIDGVFQPVSLEELPPARFVQVTERFTQQFLESGFVPHRILREPKV